MGGVTRSLAQLRYGVEKILEKGVNVIGYGDNWKIEENASGQLVITNGTNTFTFSGNVFTTDSDISSGSNQVYVASTDSLRVTGVQVGRNGPVNLAGVVGNYDGEIRVDDGTNTTARGVECVWDDFNGLWRPSDSPSAGAFS